MGTVEPRPGDLSPAALSAWHQRHTTADGHDHVHGANLGFTLAAYRSAGGFPPVPTHEDVALVAAARAAGVDTLILGCTHYEIVADLFRDALPEGTPLIRQPDATADALARYLERHPEFDTGTGAVRRFLTTGEPGVQNSLVETFWGGPLSFEKA